MSAQYLETRFLKVGCGDGIRIRFLGNDSLYHNIIIDGGTYKGTVYEGTLQKEILNIIQSNEIIDLWIISHIDDDHIGGILRLIKDKETLRQIDLKKTTFWFNYSISDYDTGIKENNLKSVSQGILLRDFLKENVLLVENITDAIPPLDFYGCRISILSPNKKKYDALLKLWEKEEIIIRKKQETKLKSASGTNDYQVKIEHFNLDVFNQDDSPENASSIALLLEYADKKILLLADSIPTVVVNALKGLGYSPQNKLILDLMQMPHHGNKRNLNDELLDLVTCTNFVASADALNKNNLPNKEAFARVIKQFPGQNLNFYITQKNQLTESIFSVDQNIKNVSLNFPELGTNALIFK
ncbi:MAG: ComEC/Rec2 family competence protein [Bacteroidia bacterium]